MNIKQIAISLLITELLIRCVIWFGLLPGKAGEFIEQSLDWHQRGEMQIVNKTASYVRLRPNEKSQELNSLGFHSPEITYEKSSNKKRIAFIGGSTTFDKGPIEETYAHFTSSFLNDNNFANDYLNAGTSGYTSTESLFAYYLRIQPFDPDILVFYNARNDIYGSGNNLYDIKDLTNRYQPPEILEPSTAHQVVSNVSVIYAIVCEIVGFHALRKDHWDIRSRYDSEYRERIGGSKELDEYIKNIKENGVEKNYRKNVTTLATLTQIDGVKLVFIGFDYKKEDPSSGTIPKDRDITVEEMEVLNDKILALNRILKEVSLEYDNVHFYDLYGQIDRNDFLDDCHLNLNGKKVKGEKVGEFILGLSKESDKSEAVK